MRPIAPDAREDETIQMIVSLYEELSVEGRKRAMQLLTGKKPRKPVAAAE
jgi:hypothetical protein